MGQLEASFNIGTFLTTRLHQFQLLLQKIPNLLLEVRYFSKGLSILLFNVIKSNEGDKSNRSKESLK
tara:strand:- start:490 stop:690 length:201 start_codon:yes stop_codon:yes gene_type:complete